MSGDWLKVERGTPDKPEIWLIAEILEIDPDAAFGKSFRVWGWFDEHTEDGNAPSVTKRLLDRLVGVTGFCEAMIQAGWLIEKDGIISVPNFDKHNGVTGKKRANTNRRVAKHRENSSAKEKDAEANDKEKRKGNANSNAEGNASGVTKSVTREEKRREEKESNKTTAPSDKSEQPVYAYRGENFNINQADFAKHNEFFPNLDLLREYPQIDLELRDTAKKQIWGALNAKLNYRNNQRQPTNQFGGSPKVSTIDQATAINRSEYERTQQRIAELEAQNSNVGALANVNA